MIDDRTAVRTDLSPMYGEFVWNNGSNHFGWASLLGQLPGRPARADRLPLDKLLPQVDALTLHCPLNNDTLNMIGARELNLMKPTAFLINTARGDLIDEEALIAALQSGHLAGAGLDVFAREPAVDPRLIALPNVITLPHLGSATIEGREASGEKVIANIRAWCDGHRPPDQVLEGWA